MKQKHTLDLDLSDDEHEQKVEASIDEMEASDEQPIENVEVEPFPTPLTVSKELLTIAKTLTGKPIQVPEESLSDYDQLVELGIAANFGNDGYARGYKWKQYCK